MANLEEPSDGQGQRGYVARIANVITTALGGGVVAVSAAMDYADDGLMDLCFAGCKDGCMNRRMAVRSDAFT